MSGLKLDYHERMRAMERRRRFAAIFLTFACALALSLGSWFLARRVNYALQYEDMVRATVREMVISAALKVRP